MRLKQRVPPEESPARIIDDAGTAAWNADGGG